MNRVAGVDNARQGKAVSRQNPVGSAASLNGVFDACVSTSRHRNKQAFRLSAEGFLAANIGATRRGGRPVAAATALGQNRGLSRYQNGPPLQVARRIGATGFEPATSASRTQRSSQAELRPDQLMILPDVAPKASGAPFRASSEPGATIGQRVFATSTVRVPPARGQLPIRGLSSPRRPDRIAVRRGTS